MMPTIEKEQADGNASFRCFVLLYPLRVWPGLGMTPPRNPHRGRKRPRDAHFIRSLAGEIPAESTTAVGASALLMATRRACGSSWHSSPFFSCIGTVKGQPFMTAHASSWRGADLPCLSKSDRVSFRSGVLFTSSAATNKGLQTQVGASAFIFLEGNTMASNRRTRPDRNGPYRAQFEANRKIIIATQSICGICGKPVDKSLKYPHPMSATVDHIIPLSRNGDPSALENLQLAHRCCNRAKSDRLTPTAPIRDRNGDLPLSMDWKNN